MREWIRKVSHIDVTKDPRATSQGNISPSMKSMKKFAFAVIVKNVLRRLQDKIA